MSGPVARMTAWRRLRAGGFRTALLLLLAACGGQPVPMRAQDSVLSVERGGARQAGILSVQDGATPLILAVLVPGAPGIIRPQQSGPGTVRSRQADNFLVRSRGLLLAPDIATLVVDCRSDFDAACDDGYQSREERVRDIEALATEARRGLPHVSAVWLIATSRGAITSAAAVRHGRLFDGVVHTAGTLDLARELGLDFRGTTPQYLVHHVLDPCRATPYQSALDLSRSASIPLISVHGGSGAVGQACRPFSQHGFWSVEAPVMDRIQAVLRGTNRGGGDLH